MANEGAQGAAGSQLQRTEGGWGEGGLGAWTPERSDAVVSLEDEILGLAHEIDAAIHRMLLLLARFDALHGWELGGFPSCAHWLAARAGIDLGAAREKVRTARALEGLPLTQNALSRGAITYSQARALTRVATPDDEGVLLAEAEGRTTAQVERLVRGWKLGNAADEVEREEVRQQSRGFSVFPDLDGMYRVQGRLTPEQGALLMRAIDQMGDLLFQEPSPGAPYETPKALAALERSLDPAQQGAVDRALGRSRRDSEAAAARRRADALALLAERAMAQGGVLGDGIAGEGGIAAADGIAAAEDGIAAADADGHGPGGETGSRTGKEIPISGSSAERYQVLLFVDLEALEKRREGVPAVGSRALRSFIDDRVRVSQETSRRRCCDAAVVPVETDSAGSVLNLGQRARTVSPALRRALEARDGGCRFPGCGRRYTEAHHVRHWADGGETSLANCVLLCRHHHRLVHEGGWQIRAEAVTGEGMGTLAFVDPRGQVHADRRWAIRRKPGVPSPERNTTLVPAVAASVPDSAGASVPNSAGASVLAPAVAEVPAPYPSYPYPSQTSPGWSARKRSSDQPRAARASARASTGARIPSSVSWYVPQWWPNATSAPRSPRA